MKKNQSSFCFWFLPFFLFFCVCNVIIKSSFEQLVELFIGHKPRSKMLNTVHTKSLKFKTIWFGCARAHKVAYFSFDVFSAYVLPRSFMIGSIIRAAPLLWARSKNNENTTASQKNPQQQQAVKYKWNL